MLKTIAAVDGPPALMADAGLMCGGRRGDVVGAARARQRRRGVSQHRGTSSNRDGKLF